jgi:hypothetical protein
MKNTNHKLKNILFLVIVLFTFSCSKDAYEETINSQKNSKQKPNLKLNFISTKENPHSLDPLLRQYAKKIKREQNPNARGEILSTLEGDFGVVKLDRVLEVNEGTYKTESFEVDEAVKNPNIYYNLIIDKNENIWLYKIEKLTQAKNNYPANSELITRMELDANLNMSTPCDSIIYPPFGYYTPETIPNSGSGGAIPGGWFDNPSPGSGGIITGGFFNSGSGVGSSGSSSIGGSGSSSGVVELIAAIGDAFIGAWNWLIDLFTGDEKPGENKPCNCGHRSAVVIDEGNTPCGDLGYIAVIAQDEYVDKILNFQNYFTVLHNNDNVFLYENHAIVDYIDSSIAQHPNNFELHNLFPEIISAVRLNKITWNFGKDYINQSIIQDGLDLDLNNSFNSPFFIDMNSVSGNTPEEVKFREVYNALMQSTKFKELFYDLFNNTPLFNVKFTIENIPQQFGPGSISGACKKKYINSNPVPYNNIIIDRNFILNNSNLAIAQTIIHECIHAYLNIKLYSPNIGMSITNINDLDFQECINTYYNNFSVPQTQHSFFADSLIPTLKEIFIDTKDLLLTPDKINSVDNPTNGVAFLYQPLNNPPDYQQSSVQVQWNWNIFFTYLSYTGLQNCNAFPFAYPQISNINDYYFFYYITIYNLILKPN